MLQKFRAVHATNLVLSATQHPKNNLRAIIIALNEQRMGQSNYLYDFIF